MPAARENAEVYVERARQAMKAVDALPAALRRLVHEHGTVAVAEGQAFAGTDLPKLAGFLAKRRDRRQAELLRIDIHLRG